MDLILTRKQFESWGIISNLIDTDGNLVAVCLEHAWPQEDGSYLPKIPNGTYACVLGTHQLDHGGPQQLYEITGVKGHSGILLHMGNYNNDSDGCVLVGEALGNQMVTNSHIAFKSFMDLEDGQNFNLKVQ